jgi:hypothetical protein
LAADCPFDGGARLPGTRAPILRVFTVPVAINPAPRTRDSPRSRLIFPPHGAWLVSQALGCSRNLMVSPQGRGLARHFYPLPPTVRGKLRWEPATKRLDWSFAPILKFDKRFARQYCFGPPPRFLLASTYPSIARRFSGPNITRSNSGRSPKTPSRRARQLRPEYGRRLVLFA